MNIPKFKDTGGEVIIQGQMLLAFDESNIAVVKNGQQVGLSITDIPKLVRALKTAERKMLDNYKNLSLDKKAEYQKVHDIKYSDIQIMITSQEKEK